ncbi:sigma-70 family RNA polymerase sigma factor [Drancourtella sp. An12]|uniref:sigma-70 family RNA polymerase sigma factor n=1 Tax=Drancourtella sp. An12 TaxID=1965548 RepID=UPI001FA90419|nr:sigma-70 family RNA polymerase sigma factor [Drancourtella sp. An12]
MIAFAVFNLSYSRKKKNSSAFVGCRSPPFDLDFQKIQTNGGNSVGADKKKIWIHGQFIEVTDEVYTAYMKDDRKIRYFENDLKTGRTVKDKDGNIKQILPSREDSLDRLMEDNAQQFPDSHESVEDIVIQKISTEKLHMALLRLPKKDQELIYALFYEEKTERAYAKQIGVSPSTVHRRKEEIIKKLKKYLK